MMCKCSHHKMVPSAIVLIGAVFLLKALNVLSAEFVDVAWPVLLIVAGLTKFSRGMCKCCPNGVCHR